MYRLIFLSLVLSSCGPHVINVNHKIEIDLTNLEKYFVAGCQQERPEEVELCVDEKITQFFQIVLR